MLFIKKKFEVRDVLNISAYSISGDMLHLGAGVTRRIAEFTFPRAFGMYSPFRYWNR